MVGHAYASFFADDTKSFVWVDCPLVSSALVLQTSDDA